VSLVRDQTGRRPHFYDNTPVCRIQFAGQACPATPPNGGEIVDIPRRSPHIPAFGDHGHLLEKNRANRHSLPPGLCRLLTLAPGSFFLSRVFAPAPGWVAVTKPKPYRERKNAIPSNRGPLLSCKPATGTEPTGSLRQPELALRLRAKRKIRQTNTLAKPRKTACFSSLLQSHPSFSANLFPVSGFRESVCQKTVLVQQTSTAQQMTCTRIKRDANFFSRQSSSSLTRSIASRTG
jgi:hypothetical protein